jgi:putative ATPase
VVQQRGSLAVPDHLRNASSTVGRQLGWGADYRDPHQAGGWNNQRYLPEALQDTSFYVPTRNGAEARIADRLALWRSLRDDEQP